MLLKNVLFDRQKKREKKGKKREKNMEGVLTRSQKGLLLKKSYAGFAKYKTTKLRAASPCEAANIYGSVFASYNFHHFPVLIVTDEREEEEDGSQGIAHRAPPPQLRDVTLSRETSVRAFMREGCYVAFRNPMRSDDIVYGWAGSFNNIADFAQIAATSPFPLDGFECKLVRDPIHAYLWTNGMATRLSDDVIDDIASDKEKKTANADDDGASLLSIYAKITLVFRPHADNPDGKAKAFALTLDEICGDPSNFVRILGREMWLVRNFLDADAARVWLQGGDESATTNLLWKGTFEGWKESVDYLLGQIKNI